MPSGPEAGPSSPLLPAYHFILPLSYFLLPTYHLLLTPQFVTLAWLLNSEPIDGKTSLALSVLNDLLLGSATTATLTQTQTLTLTLALTLALALP